MEALLVRRVYGALRESTDVSRRETLRQANHLVHKHGEGALEVANLARRIQGDSPFQDWAVELADLQTSVFKHRGGVEPVQELGEAYVRLGARRRDAMPAAHNHAAVFGADGARQVFEGARRLTEVADIDARSAMTLAEVVGIHFGPDAVAPTIARAEQLADGPGVVHVLGSLLTDRRAAGASNWYPNAESPSALALSLTTG